MPTIEERLQALEQEHTELKKTIELQTIAIGALVNKATLEQLNEKYDRIFDALMTHDHLTNEQLAELRNQQAKEDGKIVGLQTEMRQRFSAVDQRFDGIDNRLDGMDQRFERVETHLDGIDNRLDRMDRRFDTQDEKLSQILERLPRQGES